MKKIFIKKLSYIICCVLLAAATAGAGAMSVLAYVDYSAQNELKENRYADMMELYHDQGYVYISDIEPEAGEAVTLRIRTGRYNVTKAKIQYTVDDGKTWQEIPMKFDSVDKTGYYDYWIGTIPGQDKLCRYRFVVDNDGQKNLTYLYATGQSSYQQDIEEMYTFLPGLKTPDWSKGTYWYFIQPDAFYNADPTNDLTDSSSYRAIPWGSNVTSLRQRYGGDLKGIKEKLSHIKALGVEAVYLNPIWISNSNVGYAPSHPYEISPYLGNDEDLLELINEIHNQDMYISLDAVLSNEPADSIYINTYHEFPLGGVAQDINNPYKEMFIYYQWPSSFKTAWGNVTSNHASELLQNIYYKANNSIIQTYLKAPYKIDAWRFDAVTSFFSTETSDTNDIAAQIRKYFKSVNPDALMLVEEFVTDYIESGMWDASWNNSFANAGRNWFSSVISGSDMFATLYKTVLLPRAYGLSTINMYNDHDFSRLSDNVEQDLSKIKALQILSMTFVGSPCLYYGDEVGMPNNSSQGVVSQSRDSFEWNEKEWNYEIYSLQKALGELRQEYSALRDGAVKLGATDDVNLTAVFGRFDKHGSVISVLNQSDAVQAMEIDVKQFNVCDGDTLSDYLTGNSYTVKNGKITANIIPGGTVFVTGKETASSRGSFSLSNMGYGAQVIKTDKNSYSLKAPLLIGKLLNRSATGFAECFGNVTVKATPQGNGTVNLAITKSNTFNDAYYGVRINGNEATVIYREDKNGKEQKDSKFSLDIGDSVCIIREGDNSFYVGICSENGDVEKIEESKVTVNMPDKVYTAFETVSGELTLNNLTYTVSEDTYYEDFEGETLGSAFSVEGKELKLVGGKAQINAKDKVTILSSVPETDYTIKASVSAGSVAYLAAGESIDEFVFVKRTSEGTIAFGRHTDETDIIYAYVDDTKPDSEVILQLQYIGTDYSAVASYDGKSFFSVGNGMQTGYSYLQCGVIIPENQTAEIDYISFGNAISDKTTVCTPHTPYNADTSFTDMNHMYLKVLTEIQDGIGEWSYCNGGIERTDSKGLSQISIYSKVFEDFRAIATLQIDSNDATAGFTFGREILNDTKGKAYVLSVNKDGHITLQYNGKNLIEGNVEPSSNGIPIKLEKLNGKIHIFAGSDGSYIGSTDCEASKGYFTYFADNTKLKLCNYSVTDIKGNWLDYSGEYSFDFIGDNHNIFVNTDDLTFASVSGVGYTDVAISAELNLTKVATTDSNGEKVVSKAGIIFGCHAYEMPNVNNGFSVLISNEGSLTLEKNGEILATASQKYQGTKFSMLVTVKDGECAVYVNNSETPALTKKLGSLNGGTVGITTQKAKNTEIYGFCAEDITGIEVGESMIAKEYFASSYSGRKNSKNAYISDFSKTAEVITDWYYPKGDWRFEKGVLSGGTSDEKWNYIGLSSVSFDDFVMDVKIRFDGTEDTGFATVSFGKPKYHSQYTEGGNSVMILRSGNVRIYDGTENKYFKANGIGTITDYDAAQNDFIQLKIVKSGTELSVYANGELVNSATLTDAAAGYIGLHTSQARCSFDDISISPQ
ncbi:MAG: alpha amylase N-terminal ig-like domain-containing protein [Clostridia bacterium]|nr:alpha amylase N-terminal ig-like domain-containing protein [Clostridia bacterium]